MSVLGLIFSVGGAAFLGALWQGFKSYGKVRARHVEDLSKWRNELVQQVNELRVLIDYHRSVSADYAYQLRSLGVEPRTSAVLPSSAVRHFNADGNIKLEGNKDETSES